MLGATAVEAPVGFAGIPMDVVLVLIHLVGIPARPDLSVKIGTPNTCTDCHTGRTPGWAADAVA
ncbi:MAG: hypothetical protein ACRERE_31485 [Candidatus Entotheonellia bacterium]